MSLDARECDRCGKPYILSKVLNYRFNIFDTKKVEGICPSDLCSECNHLLNEFLQEKGGFK